MFNTTKLLLFLLPLSVFGMQIEHNTTNIKSLFQLAATPAVSYILDSLDNESLEIKHLYRLNRLDPQSKTLLTKTVVAVSPYLKNVPSNTTKLTVTNLMRMHLAAKKRSSINV